jgi:hypothetical protein
MKKSAIVSEKKPTGAPINNRYREFLSPHHSGNVFGVHDMVSFLRAKNMLVPDAASLVGDVQSLAQAAIEGDERAIENLFFVATTATCALNIIKPQQLKAVVTRRIPIYPVLASLNPNWPTSAKERVKAVEMGADTFGHRIAPKAYCGSVWRKWAFHAVVNLDVNRQLVHLWGHEKEAVPVPSWVSKCGNLEPFSPASAAEWAKLAREMIRQQCAKLECEIDARSLQNIREGLARRGKDTPGHLRGAILDKICGAIRTIAKTNPSILST